MGVGAQPSVQEDKMFAVVLAALLGISATTGRPQLPAGLSAAACPNYPFCGAQAPADFPTPVVNGEPIAPILNTNPAQTRSTRRARLTSPRPGSQSPSLTARMLLQVTTP